MLKDGLLRSLCGRQVRGSVQKDLMMLDSKG